MYTCDNSDGYKIDVSDASRTLQCTVDADKVTTSATQCVGYDDDHSRIDDRGLVINRDLGHDIGSCLMRALCHHVTVDTLRKSSSTTAFDEGRRIRAREGLGYSWMLPLGTSTPSDDPTGCHCIQQDATSSRMPISEIAMWGRI